MYQLHSLENTNFQLQMVNLPIRLHLHLYILNLSTQDQYLLIRTTKGHENKIYKGNIPGFGCWFTRAIHLEAGERHDDRNIARRSKYLQRQPNSIHRSQQYVYPFRILTSVGIQSWSSFPDDYGNLMLDRWNIRFEILTCSYLSITEYTIRWSQRHYYFNNRPFSSQEWETLILPRMDF